MVRLAEAHGELVEQRALARRQRDEERMKRFFAAKTRQIGIDVESLDQQVEEKKKRISQQRELEKEEAQYEASLIHHLEQEEAAELKAREQEVQSVKQTLLEQMKQPKNNADKMSDPPDLDACGLSSVQRFVGEDTVNKERTKLQQEQIKQWCAQQVAERRQRECEELQDNAEYAEYVAREDEVRAEMAQLDEEDRAQRIKAVQQYNRQKAEEVKLQRMIRLQDEKEEAEAMIAQAQESSLLSEDTRVSRSELASHRYRPDHFKGYDEDVVKSIYRDNDLVLAERREKEQEEEQYEEEWSEHQNRVIVEMEAAEKDRQIKSREEELKQAIFLEMQRKELKEKQMAMKVNRFGEIGEQSLFSRFGKSLT